MGVTPLIRANSVFFLLHTLLLLWGSYPLLAFDKVSLLLWLNGFHHPFLDYFFYHTTSLGSGVAYALFVVILIVMRSDNRTLLAGTSNFIVISLIVQGMKRLVFFNQLRPITLVAADVSLHLVKGVVPYTHFSFPSGHAAFIFAIVCFIHLLIPRKPVVYSVLLLLVAVVTAYSRMYLCQHFYRDIYVGAWLGTWVTTAVYSVFMRWQGPAWLDQNLFNKRYRYAGCTNR